MPATAAASPVAFLRRAALLTGLLAVIAGFLGMHMLSGSHDMHGIHGQVSPVDSITRSLGHTAGPAPSGDTASHPAGHSGHGAAGSFAQAHDGPAAATTAPAAPPGAATVRGTQAPPSCVCQGGCAGKPSAHIDCTPSPAGASSNAPQPGTSLLGAQAWTALARADLLSSYAYLPGTPTPRDLSISRT